MHKWISSLLVLTSMAYAASPLSAEAVGSEDEHIQYWVRTVQTHPMQMVRKNAARVLGTLGTNDVISVLIQALKDPYFGVRVEAARSLGNMGDDRPIPELQDVGQRDPDAQVRRNARDAVEKIRLTIEYRRKKQERLEKKLTK
jgi:HEAT repeat protein